MTELQELESQQQLVLLPEIGALIHDLGKLSKAFVGNPGKHWHSQILNRFTNAEYVYFTSDRQIQEHILDWIERDSARVQEPSRSVLIEIIERARKEEKNVCSLAKWFIEVADQKLDRKLVKFLERNYWGPVLQEQFVNALEPGLVPSALCTLLNESVTLFEHTTFTTAQRAIGDVIALHHDSYVMPLPQLIQLLKAPAGADGFDSWIDKQGANAKQKIEETYIATAFGYEPASARIDLEALASVRQQYANTLAQKLQKITDAAGDLPIETWRELLCDPKRGLRARTETAFRYALGETQRPANDVTLWDHSYSTASLYKASLAKVLLEGSWTEPAKIGWRFLRVAVDGPAFWGQAHHITDMLGRRVALTEALDRVRQALEITYPVGNEIYRDENGSIFVLPALDANLHADFQKKVEKLVRDVFDSPTSQKIGIAGEMQPRLFWNSEGAVRGQEEGLPDMARAFGQLTNQDIASVMANPRKMADWWQATDTHEICTVCGVRPVGYKPLNASIASWATPEKANKRHVCCVCLERRGQRAKDWLTKQPQQTIWTDEVVDSNGRFALLVGKFDLTQWLDGTLVRTMSIAEGKSKNPSPARVRRVWETTHTFWEEVQTSLILETLHPRRPRLAIKPDNVSNLLNAPKRDRPGDYYAYELQIGGQTIGVVWDPLGKEFILTEYLDDLARRLNLKKNDETPTIVGALRKWFADHAHKAGWLLLEPSGYASPAQAKGIRVKYSSEQSSEIESYTPHIPLLTEPALFMALVPADKAVDIITAIKQKYEREMSKVQDRLPLHLGAVIAPRRTPMRVVLDAGRAMLERPSAWERWTVNEEPAPQETPPSGLESDANFAHWWKVSLKKGEKTLILRIAACMGDGETKDVWHTHFLLEPPSTKDFDPGKHMRHVSKLTDGDTVFLAPATFDFEYLDTTARRFAIAYDTKTGRRRDCPTRPYRLAEVETLKTAWRLISTRLTNSQWMALDSLIEAKRTAWNEPRGPGADYSDIFTRFVADTLHNAEWRWPVVGQEKRETRRGWRAFTGAERELLEHAARHGVLRDVVDLYHEALKMDPKEAQA